MYPRGGFLAQLDEGDRSALLALGRTRRFRPGATLFSEGDRSDQVMLIREGRVKVFCTTAEGREPLLAMHGPGELLGELAAIDEGGHPRSASVVATEAVVVQEIGAADFRRYVGTHPAAAMALLRTLTRRLRGADRRRVEYGGYDTPHRLAHLLVEMLDEHGVPEGAGVRLDMALSQEELAAMIGASRESVARALARLRTAGLVETRRRGIFVADLDRLRSRA